MLTHTVDGYPGSILLQERHGLVVSENGTGYLTTTQFDGNEFTTTAAVFTAAGVAQHTVSGIAGGPAVITTDGTVYQTIGIVDLDSTGTDATVTTAVAVVSDAGIVVLGDTVAGIPFGGPVVAGDDSVYQLVFSFDSGAVTGTSGIASITATGLSTVTADIPRPRSVRTVP